MRRSLSRSNRHFRSASTRLPMGVSSNFRYWGDDRTLYVSHARGALLWDIDGNEYVDYRLGYGPAILGYGDPRVDAAGCARLAGHAGVRGSDRLPAEGERQHRRRDRAFAGFSSTEDDSDHESEITRHAYVGRVRVDAPGALP